MLMSVSGAGMVFAAVAVVYALKPAEGQVSERAPRKDMCVIMGSTTRLILGIALTVLGLSSL